MKIADLSPELAPSYLVCLEDWSEEMKEARFIKEDWFSKMREQGLRVKVAIDDDGSLAGMIEYMPIEYSYADGDDLYMVNCIWVHGYEDKGVGNRQGAGLGKALLEAAEEDLGAKGLAAWGISQDFWMTAAWYKKQGYEKADLHGWRELVWKPFSGDAVVPKWKKGEFSQETVPGKVKVTVFCSGQCPGENTTYLSAKRAAERFGENVSFEEIDMSDAANLRKYGLGGGLYIAGENIFTGPPPSYDQIVEKIEEKLNALEG